MTSIRGASKVTDEVEKRGLPIAVAVIPKTIDNNVPIINRTFGFETAIKAARRAIDVASTKRHDVLGADGEEDEQPQGTVNFKF